MSLTQDIRTETLSYIEQTGRVTREAILDHLFDRLGGEIAAESDRRKREWVWQVANNAIKSAISKAGGEVMPAQPVLPGFPPPTVISVDAESFDAQDVTYVAFGWARWADLQGHHALKVSNVIHAQEALNDWRDKMDALRPYMEAYPDRTVQEALDIMAAAQSH